MWFPNSFFIWNFLTNVRQRKNDKIMIFKEINCDTKTEEMPDLSSPTCSHWTRKREGFLFFKRMATSHSWGFTALDFEDRKNTCYPTTLISNRTSILFFNYTLLRILNILIRMSSFKQQKNYRGVGGGIFEGDVTVYFYQNLTNCILKSMHFTICKYLTFF